LVGEVEVAPVAPSLMHPITDAPSLMHPITDAPSLLHLFRQGRWISQAAFGKFNFNLLQ
jgi:hypothetical protein